MKIIIMIIATNAPSIFDQDFDNPLKAANARATHKARINICTIEIFNGPIVKDIPANNPLLIFLG